MQDRNEQNRERYRSGPNLVVYEFLRQRVPKYVLLEDVRDEVSAKTYLFFHALSMKGFGEPPGDACLKR